MVDIDTAAMYYVHSYVMLVALIFLDSSSFLFRLLKQVSVKRLTSLQKRKNMKTLVNGGNPSLITCTGVRHQPQMAMDT